MSLRNRKTDLTLDLDEYLALDGASERRFEYWDGDVVCMSGASPEHNQITSNLNFALRRRLEGRHCRVFVSDMRVKTPAIPPYRYPDVVALCHEPSYELVDGVNTLLNPSLIVEVLSPESEKRDREDKYLAYRQISSFAEYLLVRQDRVEVTLFAREPNGAWSEAVFSDPSSTVSLVSLGGDLPLPEVYEELSFLNAPDRE